MRACVCVCVCVCHITGGEVRNVTFQLFQRSAAQGNIASLLAMGDAYFYGRGVHQDWQKASAIYYEVGVRCTYTHTHTHISNADSLLVRSPENGGVLITCTLTTSMLDLCASVMNCMG